MHWTLDTGACGAAGCDAADLGKVLADAKAFFVNDAPKQAERFVMSAMNTSNDPTKGGVQPDKHAEHVGAVVDASRAAKAAFLALLPKLEAQMDLCIKQACEQADAMGGKVTATVTGHYFTKDRADGIFKRVEVKVQRAAPTEE